MFFIQKFHSVIFLLILLLASCGSDTGSHSGKPKPPQKKTYHFPVITPKTILYYGTTTKKDLDGSSGRAPVDQKCFYYITHYHTKETLYDRCSLAGDAVMLGTVIASGDNVGCTDGKIDEFGSRYEYVIKVLHVFAGNYQEETIRVDAGPFRYQPRLMTLGDTILFSAFTSDGHWFLNTYLVNRPDDNTPFTYKAASTNFMAIAPRCPVVDLPDKVEDLDTLFQASTGSTKYNTLCPHSPKTFEEQKDFFSHKTGSVGVNPIGTVGDKCPFNPDF